MFTKNEIDMVVFFAFSFEPFFGFPCSIFQFAMTCEEGLKYFLGSNAVFETRKAIWSNLFHHVLELFIFQGIYRMRKIPKAVEIFLLVFCFQISYSFRLKISSETRKRFSCLLSMHFISLIHALLHFSKDTNTECWNMRCRYRSNRKLISSFGVPRHIVA